MTTERDKALPLFNWQPECRFIPFPMVKRIGRVRETASKLLDKPTEKSAAHYRRQVNEAITEQLAKIGLDQTAIDEQIAAFWRAVDAEAARQAYGWHHTPGGAA